MNGTLQRTPQAIRDIEDYAFYLGQQQAGLDVRFVRAVDDTFQDILRMPDLGSPCELDPPAPTDLRMRPVRNFEKYYAIYRSTGAGVEIVRVIHSSRDIQAAFTSGS